MYHHIEHYGITVYDISRSACLGLRRSPTSILVAVSTTSGIDSELVTSFGNSVTGNVQCTFSLVSFSVWSGYAVWLSCHDIVACSNHVVTPKISGREKEEKISSVFRSIDKPISSE